jgi:hypothetical protein
MLAALVGLLCLVGPAAADGETPTAASAEATDGLDALLRTIVLRAAPHEYENTKQWGGTKRIWDGLHVSRDGLRIKTKRRWKEANHGTWKQYRAWLIDPASEFDVRFDRLRESPSGRAAFDLTLEARIGAFGRLSEWNRDVQLFSVSANAEAKLRLQLTCELSSRLDYTTFPPTLVLDPTVTAADLQLIDFRLLRVSQLDGPLVHELGKALREVLEHEIRDRRHQVATKINEELADHEEDLRLTPQELASGGWNKLFALFRDERAEE